MTKLATPKGYTAANLVFSDSFMGQALDAAHWNRFMTSNSTQGGAWDSDGNAGSGVGGPLDADYFEPYEVTINNGLTLNALQGSVAGANWIDGMVRPQIFPVASGVVTSYGKMEFDGGYLQISMKEPGGDGSWPSLWLLPGAGAGKVGNNFEIDIQEGGYYADSANPNDTFAYHLHTPSGVFGGVVDTGVDLTAAYHTYAIDWKPGESITWFLDGRTIATINSAQAPIPDESMELIMSNQVATSAASSWRTSLGAASPQSMPMQVSEVDLYQSPGAHETVMGGNAAPTMAVPVVSISTVGRTTAQARQTLAGAVDAADAGAIVSIYEDGRLVGTARAGADAKWSAQVALLRQGVNTLTASVENAVGKGVSAPVAFVYHSLAPVVTISTTGQTTAQAQQTIAGSLDIADAGAKVSVYDGVRLIGSSVADASGGWSVDVRLPNSGVNAITATATNIAGTGKSAPVTFVVQPTPAAPIVIRDNANAQYYVLGDANYQLALGGYSNSITAGDGADIVAPGAGNATVKLGNGADLVLLTGFGDNVTAGDGADSVTGGAGNSVVKLGNGGDIVTLGGFYNQVSVGSGANRIDAGAGNAMISAAGGVNTVTLRGYYNQLNLASASSVVTGGGGNDTIEVSGGSASLTLNGSWEHVTLENGGSAVIADLGTGLRLDLDGSGDAVASGLAQDTAAVIGLLRHAGGFASANDVVGALRSDGHGGSLLALGGQHSLDIVGVAPSHLSPSSFALAS